MRTKDLREADRVTVQRSVELVRRARLTDLDRPTPCAGWSLSSLLDHMTAQHRGFAASAAGNGAEPARWAVRPAGADADAVEHYAAAADQVLAAFATIDDLDRPMDIPELSPRPFRASLAIGFHLVDFVVHAWDVAWSLGLPVDLPEEVIAIALPLVREIPDGPERDEPGAIFAPARPYLGTDPLTELLAHLGRSA